MQGSRGFVHDTGGGSVAVENRSGAKMTVYCAGVDRKERSVPAGGRVFVEDLGVRASAGSPLFCGVVTSDSTASWYVTALGGRKNSTSVCGRGSRFLQAHAKNPRDTNKYTGKPHHHPAYNPLPLW